MELRTYARIVLRHWWLPLACTVLAALAAYLVAARGTPIYRATAQLSVTPSIIDYFTGEAVQRLLSHYALQLRSQRFAAMAAARLPSPRGPEAVAGKIRAVAFPSEYRIAIEVDDADPARARDIANAAATAFVEQSREANAGRERRDIEVAILDLAPLPGGPIGPRPMRTAAGAAILGAGLGLTGSFILESLTRNRARNGVHRLTAAGAGGERRRSRRDPRRRPAAGRSGPRLGDQHPTGGSRAVEGAFTDGHTPGRPTGRGDVRPATLAGGRGLSHAEDQPPLRGR